MAVELPLDRGALQAWAAAETTAFDAARPRSGALRTRARATMPRGVPMSWMESLYEHSPAFVDHGSGARFTDVDGHEYLDLYLGDMSLFCGHAPPPVVEAVSARMRAGNHFLLPTEDAVHVAEHLAQRYGYPRWQFTLSATTANIEVVRIARHLTGREAVVLFDGKYHGHLDATLVVQGEDGTEPEMAGLPADVARTARVVPFNDIDALKQALAPGDVALVMTEPVMTNAGVILPDPAWASALADVVHGAGALLALDETHSLVGAWGGMASAVGLRADLFTVGKSIAAGVPLGAYGMTEDIAERIAPVGGHALVAGEALDEIATGGTLFANALAMSAARAALTEVLTPAAVDRARGLGSDLADGLEQRFAEHGLPWSVGRMGPHAYYSFAGQPARDAAGARAADDPELRALIRVWMANRGVWESGWWLGPTVSVAHSAADVETYLAAFGAFLAELDRIRP